MEILIPGLSLPILAIVIWLAALRHDDPGKADPVPVQVRVEERTKERRH